MLCLVYCPKQEFSHKSSSWSTKRDFCSKIFESKNPIASPNVQNTCQFGHRLNDKRIALIAYQNRWKIQNSIFFRRNPVLSEQNVQLSKIR